MTTMIGNILIKIGAGQCNFPGHFALNPWHPVNWIVIILLILLSFLIGAIKGGVSKAAEAITELHQVCMDWDKQSPFPRRKRR